MSAARVTGVTGVTLEFFCAAGRALERKHGPRLIGSGAGDLEALRVALQRAEQIYEGWPRPPEKSRRRKKRAKKEKTGKLETGKLRAEERDA